ncbi:MAG: hypothetical protein AABW58_02905 [Nanoarchaeota archaeon]
MLYRDWTKERKKARETGDKTRDLPLKHSLEFYLTDEEAKILHLEYLLGQKELEIMRVKEERDKLADAPFEREFDDFVYKLRRQAEAQPQERPKEPIDEDISFFRRIGEFALFVYAFYTLATSFLERPEKRRKY